MEPLVAQLAQLAQQEAELVRRRDESVAALVRQSTREADRSLDALRRALPDLDVTSKTAAELRGSIRKTMDRADAVSAKVRELDLARSRAVQALEWARRALEVRECLRGVSEALRQRDLERAADFVKRYDDVRAIAPPGGGDDVVAGVVDVDEMAEFRAELQHAVLSMAAASAPTSTSTSTPTSTTPPGETREEALRRAAVLIKVGQVKSGLEKYGSFLGSALKERVARDLGEKRKDFADVLKGLLNDAAATIEAHDPASGTVAQLTGNAKTCSLAVEQAVHAECDRQMAIVFDAFMSRRRMHERGSQPLTPTTDLGDLNALLNETCLLMQHVVSYDRFTRARAREWFALESFSAAAPASSTTTTTTTTTTMTRHAAEPE